MISYTSYRCKPRLALMFVGESVNNKNVCWLALVQWSGVIPLAGSVLGTDWSVPLILFSVSQLGSACLPCTLQILFYSNLLGSRLCSSQLATPQSTVCVEKRVGLLSLCVMHCGMTDTRSWVWHRWLHFLSCWHLFCTHCIVLYCCFIVLLLCCIVLYY